VKEADSNEGLGSRTIPIRVAIPEASANVVRVPPLQEPEARSPLKQSRKTCGASQIAVGKIATRSTEINWWLRQTRNSLRRSSDLSLLPLYSRIKARRTEPAIRELRARAQIPYDFWGRARDYLEDVGEASRRASVEVRFDIPVS